MTPHLWPHQYHQHRGLVPGDTSQKAYLPSSCQSSNPSLITTVPQQQIMRTVIASSASPCIPLQAILRICGYSLWATYCRNCLLHRNHCSNGFDVQRNLRNPSNRHQDPSRNSQDPCQWSGPTRFTLVIPGASPAPPEHLTDLPKVQTPEKPQEPFQPPPGPLTELSGPMPMVRSNQVPNVNNSHKYYVLDQPLVIIYIHSLWERDYVIYDVSHNKINKSIKITQS